MNAAYFLRLAMGVIALWASGTVLMAIMIVATVPLFLVFPLVFLYNVAGGAQLFKYLDKNGPDKPVKIDKD